MGLRLIAVMLASTLMIVGCGGAERDIDREKLESMVGEKLKDTVAVSGTVSVGGVPSPQVNIYAYPADGGREPVATCRSGVNGEYCWNTYAMCDGLPPGEYILAFKWIPDEGKGKNEGEDVLKGKYQDPTKNDFKLTVAAGAPQTGVNYELEAE